MWRRRPAIRPTPSMASRTPISDRHGTRREAGHHRGDERIVLGSDRIARRQDHPDPIPTVRELRSGSMFSPEFGGMTANIEFEALTGFSNAFLPYGSIPYQQYVRHKLPSLATFLDSEGYQTQAIHRFGTMVLEPRRRLRRFRLQNFLSEEKLPPMAKRGPLASDARAHRGDHPPGRRRRTRSSSSRSRCKNTAPTSRTAIAIRPTRSRRRSANGRRARLLSYAEGVCRCRRRAEAADRMGQASASGRPSSPSSATICRRSARSTSRPAS